MTTVSNLLRMLYSRAGDYPAGQPLLYAESFSPNTPQGACPTCHGLGRIYEVTEASMVPDDSLRSASARSPPGRRRGTGRTCATSSITLGFDIDKPWRELPKKDRDWLLFTEEQPTVPVYAGYEPRRGAARAQAQGRARATRARSPSARRYVLHTFANTAERADEEARVAVHA